MPKIIAANLLAAIAVATTFLAIALAAFGAGATARIIGDIFGTPVGVGALAVFILAVNLLAAIARKGGRNA